MTNEIIEKRFAIISPSPIKGSGGVARIFNFAAELSSSGYKTDVYVFDNGSRTSEQIRSQAEDFYGASGFRVISGIVLEGEYEFVMATRWDTAKLVRDSVAKQKLYLVQDFEVCFNPVGDGTILAENSYMYGLRPITYGRWLALKLRTEYGSVPYYLDFSSDHNSFFVKRPYRERISERLAICFIYQHDKPRRCPRLGVEALGIVKNIRPDIDIYLVGSDEAPALWFKYINCGLLNLVELNELYNKCHLGLCLSSSNPSCNPFDMMTAGLPSVELYRENNLYDMPQEAILLAHQTPESIAEALIHLLDNAQQREMMSEFGIHFMRKRTSTAEVERFLSIINEIEFGGNDFQISPHNTPSKYSATAIVATVCQNESISAHVISQSGNFAYHDTERNNNVEFDGTQSFGLVRRLSNLNNSTDKRTWTAKFIGRLIRWFD
jgi:hypothetical protein